MAYPINGPIRLRLPEPTDLPSMLAWENEPENWKVSNRTTPYSEDFLRRYLDDAGKDFWEVLQIRFVIESIQDGRAVGAVDLYDAHPVHQRAGVGILLDRTARGQGWAGLALEATHNWAFNHALLRQVYAEVHVQNANSIRLFEQSGYTSAGVWKSWQRTRQGFEDVALFQLFAPQ